MTEIFAGALRVWQRDWAVYRHVAKWLLLPAFLDPLLFLFALGLGLGHYLEGSGGSLANVDYVDFIAPGLMASSAMYQASFETAWNMLWKIETNRTYDAMVSTPIEPADIVVGEAIWAATRSAISAAIVYLVLLAFGILHSWWSVLMVPVAMCVGLVFAAIGMAFTVNVTSMNWYPYYFAMAITPMFLMSGIFFPIDELPAALRVAANATPLYHGVALLRNLAFGTVGRVDLAHAAYLIVVAPILLVPVARRMSSRLLS